MDATPIITPVSAGTSGGKLPTSGRPQFGQGAGSALAMKWSALHEAAAAVGAIAGYAAEAMRPELRDFPGMIRETGGWRREHAEQGVEDLSAIMEPGLAALLAAHARGMNPAAAAQALWQEFHAARDALLLLRRIPASVSRATR